MADPGPKSGLSSVLAAAELQAEAPGGEVEQLDLAPDLLGAQHTAGELATVRGRGRPAGSRNRRTQEWADYLGKRYGDPREVLAQIMVAPIEELAKDLACSRHEALQEKRLAATALLPYVAQKQPLAVQIGQVVHLTIGDAGAGAATLDAVAVEIVENQEDSDAAGDAV